MSIYTKAGDTGKTALFGGKRVSKYNPQVEAYGMIDEATCFIGFAMESLKEMKTIAFLSDIQFDLYSIMAYLADAKLKEDEISQRIPQMETVIDELDKELPKLTRFVLPQGGETTVRIHVARAKVRTAERRIVEYVEQKKLQTSQDLLIVQYVNRLSDLLFMLARKYNSSEKTT